MNAKLRELLESMSPQEQAEVEAFVAFMIARRKLQKPQILTDDIPAQELTQLVMESGSFGWLDAEEEDVYSIENGECVFQEK
jgi:hypothetical protein